MLKIILFVSAILGLTFLMEWGLFELLSYLFSWSETSIKWLYRLMGVQGVLIILWMWWKRKVMLTFKA